MLTEAEVIRIMRAHLQGLFPKVCPKCGKRFDTLRDFLLSTEHVGPAVPYDAEAGDWRHVKSIGTTTFANCECGSTMALTSDGMPLLKLWSCLNWARVETRKRGMTPQELLTYLREVICHQILSEPGPEAPPAKQG